MPPRVIKIAGPARAELQVTCKNNQKSSLVDFGYTDVAHQTVAQRRPALMRAVRALGAPLVVAWLKRLEAFNKNKNPELARRFRLDRQFVERQ
jgi:hypothetical protein